jgi:hypothetical protein
VTVTTSLVIIALLALLACVQALAIAHLLSTRPTSWPRALAELADAEHRHDTGVLHLSPGPTRFVPTQPQADPITTAVRATLHARATTPAGHTLASTYPASYTDRIRHHERELVNTAGIPTAIINLTARTPAGYRPITTMTRDDMLDEWDTLTARASVLHQHRGTEALEREYQAIRVRAQDLTAAISASARPDLP